VITVAVVASVAAWRLSVAAWRLGEEQKATSQQLQETRKAQGETKRELYHSLVAQARAMRMSRHVGQRVEALRSIAEAMRLPLPPGHTLDELRTEAVAALALPDIEIEREWLGGLTPGIVNLAFDDNLEKYVRLAEDGTVTARRVADDSLVASWKEADDWTFKGESFLRFSRDGRYLSVVNRSSGRLAVRRLVSPEPELCYQGEKAEGSMDFTPDGTKLAYVMTDSRIAVVDLASGQARYFQPAGVQQWDIEFAPDGRRFAISVNRNGKHTAEVRDLGTGKIEITLPHPTNEPAAWHPDGQMLATTYDRKIRFWDVRSGKIVRALEGYKTLGTHCAFDRTGRCATHNAPPL